MSNEIQWTLTEEEVEWRFEVPEKNIDKMMLEEGMALALLLINDVVMVGGFTRPLNPPPDWAPAITIAAKCSDTFGYACADAEDVPQTEIEPLYRWFRKDPVYGPIMWCITRRKCLPIQPVLESLKARGLWTEEFQALEASAR